MEGLDLSTTATWQPLASFGLTSPLYTINSVTVLNTWILIAIVAVLIIPLRFYITKQHSVIGYLIRTFIRSFMELCQQSMGPYSFEQFSFITAIFTFIFLANLLILIPFLEEPTKDLNTALAMGIISFLYVQGSAIRAHGIINYFKEFFTPFFVLFPLHVISKLATIVSISFRLFGNIFGGATITHIYFSAISGSWVRQIFGIAPGILINLFFGLFESFLQAFVFTMLTLTYLALATQHEELEPSKE